jgi:molybdopterin molybdotransferase
VSSMVSFECFARRGLRKMAGHAELDRPHVRAVADEDFVRRPDGKLHLMRVEARWVDDAYHVRSAGGQASHMLRAMALANGLALIPDGEGARAGDMVDVMLLGRA